MTEPTEPQPADESTIEEQRREWENVDDSVSEDRDGWEVDAAVALLRSRTVTVEGRTYSVDEIKPQIGFLEARLSTGNEQFSCELHYSESLGYSIEMRSDTVEILDQPNGNHSTEIVVERLENSPWPDQTEPLLEAIENDATLNAEQWYQAIQATNGQVALGFYQDSLDRLAQVMFWTPDNRLQVVSSDMNWKGSIPEMIEALETDALEPIAVPIEQAKQMGGYDEQ